MEFLSFFFLCVFVFLEHIVRQEIRYQWRCSRPVRVTAGFRWISEKIRRESALPIMTGHPPNELRVM